METLKIKNIEDILLNSSATELVLINDQIYFTTSDKNKLAKDQILNLIQNFRKEDGSYFDFNFDENLSKSNLNIKIFKKINRDNEPKVVGYKCVKALLVNKPESFRPTEVNAIKLEAEADDQSFSLLHRF